MLQNDVFHAGYLAVWQLKRTGFKKKVYVVGTEGITDELERAGYEYVMQKVMCILWFSGFFFSRKRIGLR